MSRALLACVTGIMLVVGVWDLGGKADRAELSMSECLRPGADCDGLAIHIPQHSIDELHGDVMVLTGRGYRVELRGIPPESRTTSRLAYVSASGTWGPGPSVQVERVLLHRFGRVKLVVGALSLALVLAVGTVFVMRRVRG